MASCVTFTLQELCFMSFSLDYLHFTIKINLSCLTEYYLTKLKSLHIFQMKQLISFKRCQRRTKQNEQDTLKESMKSNLIHFVNKSTSINYLKETLFLHLSQELTKNTLTQSILRSILDKIQTNNQILSFRHPMIIKIKMNIMSSQLTI